MAKRMMAAAGAGGLALALAPAVATAPRGSGTIAVTAAPEGARGDALEQATIEAVTTSLGVGGFTILNDPAHAAQVAEVTTTRTDVGTSIAKARAAAPQVSGMAVTIPTSRGKDVMVPLQRTELRIRIKRRGEQQPFWQGAAVTVRSAGARNAGVEQMAVALSQAALSSYPVVTNAAISIP